MAPLVAPGRPGRRGPYRDGGEQAGGQAAHRRHRVAAVLLVTVLVLAGGCRTSRDDRPDGGTTVPPGEATGPLPGSPRPEVVVVAEAVVPTVQVFERPDQPTSTRSVSSPRPSGAPALFVVQQQVGDRLEVLLPVRPNGSVGWIRADEVSLSKHHWRMVIELAAHRLTVFDGPHVVRVETIGVGTAATPTPGGRYFTTELLQPPRPDGPYGAYALGLSGFTGVEGGPPGTVGQMGLHGTNDLSTIGRDVTLGCIRMSNDGITALARQLPLGVPVEVRA